MQYAVSYTCRWTFSTTVMNIAWPVAEAEMAWEEHLKSCNPVKQVAVLAMSEVHWLAWQKPALHSKIKKGKWNACKKTLKEVLLLAKVNINNKIKETRLFWQTRTGDMKIQGQMQLKSSVHTPTDSLQGLGRYKTVAKNYDARNNHSANPSETWISHYVFYKSRELYSAARQPVQSTVYSRRKQGDKSAFQSRSPITWGLTKPGRKCWSFLF